MHPRNPYQVPPDFKELALKYPEFRKYAKQRLSGKIEIDFKDPEAVRALSTVLLKKDFNLIVDLPPDRLIPTIPLRLNYLLWIEDLLDLTKSNESTLINGIDIGTGACCIYPILAAKKNDWHFIATEADEINFVCSQKTVTENNLINNVTLKKVTSDSLLIGNIDLETKYDFTICNPPFFNTENFGPYCRTSKRVEPLCPKLGGSTSLNEVAFKGGEVEFVNKLIEESQDFKLSIRIFTTMLGLKSSLNPVIAMIKRTGAKSWTQTELCQGRTMRWAVAWTFLESIQLEKLAPQKTKKQPPLKFPIICESWTSKGKKYSIPVIMDNILELFSQLEIETKKVNQNKNMKSIELIARKNTWSHQRRKRRENKREDDNSPESKKAKLDEASKLEEPYFLKGLLRLHENDSVITMYMHWIEGGVGKDSMNQILQYLVNNLFK